MLSTPTLDSTAPNYKLTDGGKGGDGWPVPGAPSTTPLVPCGNPTSGPGTGSGGGGSNSGGATGGGGESASSGSNTGGANSGGGNDGGSSAIAGTTCVGPGTGGQPAGLGAGSAGSATTASGSSNASSEPVTPVGGATTDAGCSCALPGSKRGNPSRRLPLALAALGVALFSSSRRKRQPKSQSTGLGGSGRAKVAVGLPFSMPTCAVCAAVVTESAAVLRVEVGPPELVASLEQAHAASAPHTAKVAAQFEGSIAALLVGARRRR